MAPFASVQRKTLDYLNPHNDMSNILKQSNIKSKIKANNELNGGGKKQINARIQMIQLFVLYSGKNMVSKPKNETQKVTEEN